jgi:hypothetical protein
MLGKFMAQLRDFCLVRLLLAIKYDIILLNKFGIVVLLPFQFCLKILNDAVLHSLTSQLGDFLVQIQNLCLVSLLFAV